MILYSAIHTYHPDDAETLLQFLPESHRTPIKVDATPREVLASYENLPNTIHYSWLIDSITSFTLGALPAPLAGQLSSTIEAPVAKLAPAVKVFALAKLIGKLKPKAILPVCCLPPSPLNALLDQRKRKLVRLIGFLGLHHLASGLKKVIDKSAIGHIRNQLTDAQKNYLDSLERKPDPLSSNLDLNNWRGDQTALSRQLQVWGLERLGIACAEEDPSFLWHLAHHLDKGRGEVVLAQKKSPSSPKLKEQVVDLMEVL